VIQVGRLVTLHVHADPVSTVIDVGPPVFGTVRLVGVTV
jgi:hypothetical protein